MVSSLPSDQSAPWGVVVGPAPIRQILDQVRARHSLIIVPQDPEQLKQVADAINGYEHEQLWICPDRLAETDGAGIWHYFNDRRFNGLAHLPTWSKEFQNLDLLGTEEVDLVRLDNLILNLANNNPTLKQKIDLGGGHLHLHDRHPAGIISGAGSVLEHFSEVYWHPCIRPAAVPESRLEALTTILAYTFHTPSKTLNDYDAYGSVHSWQQDHLAAARFKILQGTSRNDELSNSVQFLETERDKMAAKITEISQNNITQAGLLQAYQREIIITEKRLHLSDSQANYLLAENHKLSVELECSSRLNKQHQLEIENLCQLQKQQAERLEAYSYERLLLERQQQQEHEGKLILASQVESLASEQEAMIGKNTGLQQELEQLGAMLKQQAERLEACEQDCLLLEQQQLQASKEKLSLETQVSLLTSEQEVLKDNNDKLQLEVEISGKRQEAQDLKMLSLEQILMEKENECQTSSLEVNHLKIELDNALAKNNQLLTEHEDIIRETDKIHLDKKLQEDMLASTRETISTILSMLDGSGRNQDP